MTFTDQQVTALATALHIDNHAALAVLHKQLDKQRDADHTAALAVDPAVTPAPEQAPYAPDRDDYLTAATYARAMGSNEGRYTIEHRDQTGDLVSTVAHVTRTMGTWRIVGCCDQDVHDCYECHELFGSLTMPPARAKFDRIIGLGEVVDRMTGSAQFVAPKDAATFSRSLAADKARYSAALAQLSDDELADFRDYSKQVRAHAGS